VAQLDCARDWGKPPYELFGGSKTLWWFRWKARSDMITKVNKPKEKAPWQIK